MALETEKLLDETGWLLLTALQENARLSYSELGQQVGLSAPAVADRMRKMEEAGIISGYHAKINLGRLGLPVLAIIRISSFAGQNCQRVAADVSKITEVIECYRVSGSDTAILKVAAASVEHLENIIDRLTRYGQPTTSLVFSKSKDFSIVTHDLLAWQDRQEDSVF